MSGSGLMQYYRYVYGAMIPHRNKDRQRESVIQRPASSSPATSSTENEAAHSQSSTTYLGCPPLIISLRELAQSQHDHNEAGYSTLLITGGQNQDVTQIVWGSVTQQNLSLLYCEGGAHILQKY